MIAIFFELYASEMQIDFSRASQKEETGNLLSDASSLKEEETGNLLTKTKGRYGWFPIPAPHIQTSCCGDSATENN